MTTAVYVRSHRGYSLRVVHNPELAEALQFPHYCAVIHGPDPARPDRPALLASYYTNDLADAIATGEHEFAAALAQVELDLPD